MKNLFHSHSLSTGLAMFSIGASLGVRGQDELLAAITRRIAGPTAGVLVCITIAFC